MTPAALSLWAGFVIGLAFGATGQVTGFCLNRGLRGYLVAGDGNKIRAFALALAVAVLGAQAIDAMGIVELRQSIYVGESFSWLLLPLGGLMFGYGMIAANGCGARALVLLAQGNLRSFVVLVCLGIAAYVVLTGVLAPARTVVGAASGASLSDGPQSLAYLLASAVSVNVARFVTALVFAGLLLLFAFSDRKFRASGKDVVGGLIIGALIPAGWLATGWLGSDDFDPVPLVSLTFIAPIGDTIQYAMLATGIGLDFGVAVVIGVFLGALGAAMTTNTLHLEGFTSAPHMARYMAGGALMGAGGALALGCSIGQGLTGLSTLAIGSFLAAGGILLGGFLALRGPLALPEL